MADLDALLQQRAIRRVPADPEEAQALLEAARRHLKASRAILEIDRAGAYVLCAMRVPAPLARLAHPSAQGPSGRAARATAPANGLTSHRPIHWTSCDAVRKAVTAHMTHHGYAVTAKAGAHAAVVEYASTLNEPSVEPFDRMRRNRNRSEYGTREFSESEVQTDTDKLR